MYDNEIYNNSGNNRQMTGNFSGASSEDFNSAQTGYFNHMGSADQTSQTQPVNQTSYASGTTCVEETTTVNQAAQTSEPASVNQTAYTREPELTNRMATAGDSVYRGRTAATAQNTTWTQAPLRNMGEQGKESESKEKKFGLAQKIMLSISLGLFFGIFAGIGFYGVQQASNAMQQNESEAVSGADKEDVPGISEIEDNTAPPLQQAASSVVYTGAGTNVPEIVQDVMPVMVSIINYYTERTSSFWGQVYEEEIPASGSGIIVGKTDTELLIVTNNHVVEDANRLEVTLIDGTETEAKIKGKDVDMDLAVIAIALNDLTEETKEAIAIATLGDSDNLQLGEQVIAIGNALGYGQSVTVGYISALDRELEMDDGSIGTYIQTDAAINGGNSGGALLNAAGEVIGINSAKIGGYAVEGMGYAIPITAASPIIADLMERQTRNKVSESEMGYLGIEPQNVTDQIVQMYGMPKGVYVLSVLEGTGAEAAGMIRGDVITKFDGNRISSFADLQEVLQYYAVGDTAKVTVMRPEHGEYVEHELTLTLGEKPVSNKYRN